VLQPRLTVLAIPPAFGVQPTTTDAEMMILDGGICSPQPAWRHSRGPSSRQMNTATAVSTSRSFRASAYGLDCRLGSLTRPVDYQVSWFTDTRTGGNSSSATSCQHLAGVTRSAYLGGMGAPLSRIVILALAVLVFGATAATSARPKKQSEHTSTSSMMCPDGTPIIMQGMECPRRPTRADEQKQLTQPTERRRVTTRGSGGPYVAAPLRTPSLTLTQPPTGPYIPPPVRNPSAEINQLNQSFPFNAGLGNNPTNRDAYIRQNFNR
jgi:hypothetical protein